MTAKPDGGGFAAAAARLRNEESDKAYLKARLAQSDMFGFGNLLGS